MKTIISIATRIIPRHYLQHISHFFLRFLSLFIRGNKFEDPINGKTYRKLLPYGRIKPRENAIAPDSMSLERHRLMWLFLNEIPPASVLIGGFIIIIAIILNSFEKNKATST